MFGDFGGGHFRSLVVGSYFFGIYKNAVFTVKWQLLASIEKIGYVGIFFCFGDMQLAIINFRKYPGDWHDHSPMRKGNGRNRKSFFILCHCHKKKICQLWASAKCFYTFTGGGLQTFKIFQNESLS